MARSRKTVFCIILILLACFLLADVSYAESMNGYEIKSGATGGSYLPVEGKIIISGGEVIISGKSNLPIVINGDAKVVLSDVNITTTAGAAITVESGVKAEIVLDGDNTVTSAGSSAGINVGYKSNNNMASLTISGEGKLKVSGGIMGGAGIGGNGTKDVNALNGNITIKGGTIVAVAQGSGAGIGGGAGADAVKGNKAGKIIISGGKITATGNKGGAGIGGGNYTDAAVEITGGTFNTIAGGDFAAGIGGGNENSQINVKITGGTFEEVRGYESSEEEKSGGAAIGAGAGKADTDAVVNIDITGGTIKSAVAGWGAAGVGSGANNNSKDTVNVEKDAKIMRVYTDGTKTPFSTGAKVEGSYLQVTLAETTESTLEVVNFDNSNESYGVVMPEGYRSFAMMTTKAGNYSVHGEKYFGDDGNANSSIKLGVQTGTLAAYTYLRPVDEVPPVNDAGTEVLAPENLDEAGLWGCLMIVIIAAVGYVASLGVVAKIKLKR